MLIVKRLPPTEFSNPKLKWHLVGVTDKGVHIDIPFENAVEALDFAIEKEWDVWVDTGLRCYSNP